jgi:hypothetical protein
MYVHHRMLRLARNGGDRCGSLFMEPWHGQNAAPINGKRLRNKETRDGFSILGRTCTGASVSEVTQRVGPATADSVRAERLIHRIWPGAVVGIGLAATAAWMCVLSYGFLKLVELLIVD